MKSETSSTTVRSQIATSGSKTFGSFFIELVKSDIIVAVDIEDNHKYVATEVAVYVACDGGCDDAGHANICLPATYPSLAVEEKGFDSFAFAIEDEFKCHGDYFFAIYVEVCVEGDRNHCHTCKGYVY
ncbi:hypothetical protein G7Z17_g11699 [Cylindrodendrum hubeiense]|uniref:Uncharacterized protein n=1 Tax=Cylindrodendrum hubeiense TaxID=595255 RepID=A0A9P5GWN0_9HYPO|nr:hypothetical protein G7Z17_g11699 [Cylindrodendrum hubeiense]